MRVLRYTGLQAAHAYSGGVDTGCAGRAGCYWSGADRVRKDRCVQSADSADAVVTSFGFLRVDTGADKVSYHALYNGELEADSKESWPIRLLSRSHHSVPRWACGQPLLSEGWI
jgi:hypothetical protein